MVAVFNRELLSWYLITVKLRETVEAGIVKSSSSTPSHDLELEPPPQQQEQLQSEKEPPSFSRRQSININCVDENVIEEEEEEEEEEEGKQTKSEWVISIREKLQQARQDHDAASWANLCIYRVPRSLREGDDKAFVPQIVSLGPYHHGREHLRDMERHKWRSLHRILKRTGQDVKLHLESVGELEEKARACYEAPIPLTSHEFVEMMVLDGCFVLELFRGAAEDFKHLGYSRNDPVFAMRGVMHSIQRDMIMLENQIPLFVLDRLLGLQIGEPDQRGLVAKLALRFFDPLMPTDEPLRQRERNKLESSLGSAKTTTTPFDPFTDQMELHCLDVFRRSLLRKGPGPESPPRPSSRNWMKWRLHSRVADKRRQQLIYCVTELKEAGVKFRKRKTDRFWDIKFENGVLWIPRLLIHDGTKSLFLNLIAFEQCHLDCGNDITAYVIFMDNLINSPEDVGYLHYCDIIEHWLGSDKEVADLFHRLCQEVVYEINDSDLYQLSEEVNRYHSNKWNAWKASLKHNYFNSPWAIISVVAAFFLLLMSFAQSFYSVYAYYVPNS